MIVSGRSPRDTPVRDIMQARVQFVHPTHTNEDCMALMAGSRVRHLPVIEDGALIGFVSIGDLVKYRIDRIESEAAAMRDYIQSA